MPYTVVAVHDEVRQWNSTNGGPMNSYRVDLKDSTGQVSHKVEWARKVASDPPTVGQQIDGDINNTDYGLKLKPAFQAGGPRGRSPEETRAIVRQHSQDMALRALELAHTLGIPVAADTVSDLAAMVFRVATAFDNDVKRARDAA